MVKTLILCFVGPQTCSVRVYMSSRVLCVLAFSQIKPRSPALSLQIVGKQNVLWPCNPAPATSKPRFPTPKATLDYDSSLTVTGESSVALWVCSLIGKKDVKTNSEEAWRYFITV